MLEIKFQAPYAIDAILSPELRLLDGVEFPGHRRNVVAVTASARWRGVHEDPLVGFHTVLNREEPAPLERRLGGAVGALALERHRRGAREPVPARTATDVAGVGGERGLGEVEEGGARHGVSVRAVRAFRKRFAAMACAVTAPAVTACARRRDGTSAAVARGGGLCDGGGV